MKQRNRTGKEEHILSSNTLSDLFGYLCHDSSGGSGYTLNKAALKALVVHGLPKLYVNTKTSAEDVLIAWVFRRMGIFPYETKDATGAERYNPLSPGRHYRYRNSSNHSNWYKRFGIDIQYGLNHSATHSVAFHYIKYDEMYRLHALLHGMCRTNETIQNSSSMT